MSEPEKTTTRINVAIPATGYRRCMLFNRFSVQRIDSHSLIYFGLVDESGVLRDSYCCAFSQQTMTETKDSMLKFLAKFGIPGIPLVKWLPPTNSTSTDMGTHINVGISTNAEFLICSMAIGPAVAKSKKSVEPIVMDAIAMLRCDVDLIKLLIAEMYRD